MGGPKALMRVGHEPWWVRQYARLGAMGLASTWVVSEAVHAVLGQERSPPPRRVVADSAAPMFASVLAGFRTLVSLPTDEREGVFVLPVDGPVPQRRVLELLAESDGVAAPAHEARRGHPIFFPWDWIDRMLDDIARDPPDPADLRLDRMIAPVVRHVAVADAMVTVNLNTPGDVEAFLASERLGG